MILSLHWKKKLQAKALEQRYCNDRVRLFAHSELHRLYQKYVPMQTGALANTVEITPEYVRHVVPYAARMYYGVGFNFSTEKHALATAMWDKVAMETQRDKLTRAVAAYMRRQA
mgnify:CR=1 FL=1